MSPAKHFQDCVTALQHRLKVEHSFDHEKVCNLASLHARNIVQLDYLLGMALVSRSLPLYVPLLGASSIYVVLMSLSTFSTTNVWGNIGILQQYEDQVLDNRWLSSNHRAERQLTASQLITKAWFTVTRLKSRSNVSWGTHRQVIQDSNPCLHIY
jgi:hypothetical protein